MIQGAVPLCSVYLASDHCALSTRHYRRGGRIEGGMVRCRWVRSLSQQPSNVRHSVHSLVKASSTVLWLCRCVLCMQHATAQSVCVSVSVCGCGCVCVYVCVSVCLYVSGKGAPGCTLHARSSTFPYRTQLLMMLVSSILLNRSRYHGKHRQADSSGAFMLQTLLTEMARVRCHGFSDREVMRRFLPLFLCARGLPTLPDELLSVLCRLVALDNHGIDPESQILEYVRADHW